MISSWALGGRPLGSLSTSRQPAPERGPARSLARGHDAVEERDHLLRQSDGDIGIPRIDGEFNRHIIGTIKVVAEFR